ncbi:MAG: D-alanine--D-alanine ligase [Agarilytica sp.]
MESAESYNVGLPLLSLSDKPVSFFEFWPAWVLYIPIGLYWVLLSLRYRSFGLPMAVNPNIALGGMVGESKYEILEQGGDLAQSYILPYVIRDQHHDASLHNCDETLLRHVENDLIAAKEKGISFPFIVKPELGCRGAGVQVISSGDELLQYLRGFPQDRRYLLQELAPYSAEAGIFYERFPGKNGGQVTSVTLKYRPTVIGDGKKSIKSLILSDPRASVLREQYLEKNNDRLHVIPKADEEIALAFAGSHCRGSIFRNGNEYITDTLTKKIDEIMLDFPDFYYGRLDIKFKDIASLSDGNNFVIIEVNGVSSEKTHIWDSRTSLFEAFSTLFEQYTTLFKMGYAMRELGYKIPSIRVLIKTWWQELQRSNTYPSTD